MLKEYEVTLRSNPKDPTALEVSDLSVSRPSNSYNFCTTVFYHLSRVLGIVVKDFGLNHFLGQTL